MAKAGAEFMKEIREWFQHQNPTHILAFYKYQRTKAWPANFIPSEVWFLENGWQEELRRRICQFQPLPEVTKYMEEMDRYIVKLVDDPRSHGDDLTSSLLKFEWSLARYEHWWWVAFDINGDWAGFSGLALHGDDEVTVYSGPSFVKPEHRGRGLQQLMYVAKENFARERGFCRVLSATEYDNIHSANNLFECGFRLRKPWDSVSNIPGLYWEKALV